MFLYHATKESNFNKILIDGKLRTGMDGCVYFTTKEAHSVNWVDMINYDAEDIISLRVHINKLDHSKIKNGSDHDQNFFKGIVVKTYIEDIPLELLDDKMMQYESQYKQIDGHA